MTHCTSTSPHTSAVVWIVTIELLEQPLWSPSGGKSAQSAVSAVAGCLLGLHPDALAARVLLLVINHHTMLIEGSTLSVAHILQNIILMMCRHHRSPHTREHTHAYTCVYTHAYTGKQHTHDTPGLLSKTFSPTKLFEPMQDSAHGAKLVDAPKCLSASSRLGQGPGLHYFTINAPRQVKQPLCIALPKVRCQSSTRDHCQLPCMTCEMHHSNALTDVDLDVD